MNNLKIFRAVIVILFLSILSGCSDNITSSGETGSPQNGEGVKAPEKARLYKILPSLTIQTMLPKLAEKHAKMLAENVI